MDFEQARAPALGCLAVVIALPLAFLLFQGPPHDPEAERAIDVIRRHTSPADELGDGASASVSLPGLAAPAGWEIADPFTSQTPYWPSFAFLPTTRDPPGSRRILLRSPIDEQSQVFLVYGPGDLHREELGARLEERAAHPLLGAWEELRLETADGLAIDLWSHGLGEGLIAGEALAQLTGVCRLGQGTLIVDAGGAAERFDRAKVLEMLEASRFDSVFGIEH